MSRRKTKKNKRLNSKSKSEFVRSVCKTCGLCDVSVKEVSGKNALSLFCYDFFYTYSPQSFLTSIYSATKKIGFWDYNVEEAVPTIDEMKEFQDIFCNSGVCATADLNEHLECSNIEGCIGTFREYVISACVEEDDDDDDVDEQEFMANNWDGNHSHTTDDYGQQQISEYTGQGQANPPEHTLHGQLDRIVKKAGITKQKANCKKRGKNKAQKKRHKKQNKKNKQAFVFHNVNKGKKKKQKVDTRPTVTFFSNMTDEQVAHIFGEEHEDNNKEQTKTAGGTG